MNVSGSSTPFFPFSSGDDFSSLSDQVDGAPDSLKDGDSVTLTEPPIRATVIQDGKEARLSSKECSAEQLDIVEKTGDIWKIAGGAALIFGGAVGAIILLGAMAFPPAGAAVVVVACIVCVVAGDVLITQGFNSMDEAMAAMKSPVFHACQTLYESDEEDKLKKFIDQVNDDNSQFNQAIKNGLIVPNGDEQLKDLCSRCTDDTNIDPLPDVIKELKALREKQGMKFKEIYQAKPAQQQQEGDRPFADPASRAFPDGESHL